MNTSPPRYDRVTVFGGATIDRIARSEGPPVMGASNPGHVERRPGGVAFNVASILARLGVPTRLVTRIGADDDGEAIIAEARTAGVDTAATTVSPDTATASYHAIFDHRGDLVIGVAAMDICEELTPAVVGQAAGAGAGAFWVVDANLPTDTLDFLVEQAAVTGHPLAALTVSPAKAVRLMPLLDRIGYLFANKREAAALLGRDPATAAAPATLAADLAGMRPTRIVVTGGTEPVVTASGPEIRSHLPLRADVNGVNGAGDSLAAGTIAAITEGRTLSEAIRFGLAAAALTLEHGGVAKAPFRTGALTARLATGSKAGNP